MSEFTIRSESVDVEQIMKQIRARILEKRGADYTEDQIRELASVRLEKFLEPKNLRSDLLEQFRKSRPAVGPLVIDSPKIEAPFEFDDQTLFASHRGLMRFARKLFRPLLKLFFNPNTLNQILHVQSQFNVDLLKREARRRVEHQQFERSRGEWNALYYEVLHNIVIETTRTGIEMQNLRMRVESLSSRLDFSERRVRALEGVVQYRPEVIDAPIRREREDDEPAAAPAMSGSLEGFVPTGQQGQAPQGQGDASRKRRRRRRGRRGGAEGSGASGAAGASGASGAAGATNFEGDDDGPDDGEAGDEGDVDERETQAAMAAPSAPDASASARQDSSELRRDLDDLSAEASAKAEAASGREVGPAAPDAPGSSNDGEQ